MNLGALTDTAAAGSASQSASVSLNKFDAATGVLTDATVNVSGSSNDSVTATGSRGANGNATVTVTGNSSVSLSSTGGASAGPTAGTSITNSCTANGGTSCGNTSTPAARAADLTANGSSLNDFVGSGQTYNASVTRSATVTSATSTNTDRLTPSGSYNAGAFSGTVQATYTYLLHAAPSFDALSGPTTSLTLNFGTVLQNASVSPLTFLIMNQSGDRTGLDFTGVSGGGAPFSLTATTFTNLAAGNSAGGGSVAFNTGSVGSFSQVYTLSFADTAGIGATASQWSNQTLTLTVEGTVAAVPEPSEWAMMIAGLGIVGLIARKRRQSQV